MRYVVRVRCTIKLTYRCMLIKIFSHIRLVPYRQFSQMSLFVLSLFAFGDFLPRCIYAIASVAISVSNECSEDICLTPLSLAVMYPDEDRKKLLGNFLGSLDSASRSNYSIPLLNASEPEGN